MMGFDTTSQLQQVSAHGVQPVGRRQPGVVGDRFEQDQSPLP